ncbi:hypothetical protein [Paenibacillus massiliensis]|uniref:hypothetical protein n=1 Tax=Paenibacillus massiliensis TaxID=225917 RepID=UPI00047279BB|nr:hypothetical protein [Paenibacillus massiliensis]
MMGLNLSELRELDGFEKLLMMAYSLKNWEEVVEIADQMFKAVHETLGDLRTGYDLGMSRTLPRTKRSLVYYYGYSLMIKGMALRRLGRVEEERVCIEHYQDLGWLVALVSEGQKDADELRILAEGNRYALDILQNQWHILPQYVRYMEANPQETVPVIRTILEAAIKHEYNVDAVLIRFEDHLHQIDLMDTSLKMSQYTTVLNLLMLYYFHNENYGRAIDYTLHTLELFIRYNESIGFRKCVAFMESFRTHASPVQLERYAYLLTSLLSRELDEDDGVVFDGQRLRAL